MKAMASDHNQHEKKDQPKAEAKPQPAQQQKQPQQQAKPADPKASVSPRTVDFSRDDGRPKNGK